MSALEPGTLAPDFTLPTTDGKQFSLAEARRRGPVVLVAFKVSCPVCQFALPYLERMHKAYGGRGVTVAALSQNTQRETVSFMRDYGITFRVALDDTRTYAVSNSYGLTNVPTVFLVAPDGEILISSVGWAREDFEALNRHLAKVTSAAPPQIFKPEEDVPEFRPG